MSKEEFESIIPVRPPKVNKKMNPLVHNKETEVSLEEEP